jgi:hypothetical protein
LVLLKVNLVRRLGPIVGTPALARELLFTPDTPQSIVDGVVPRLQDESYYADRIDTFVSTLKAGPTPETA